MESSKLLLRRAGAECHKNHASQRLQGAFLNLLAAQPCLSTFLYCLFTTQEHKWRHGVRQHLSAFRSFQTEYFIRSIYSLSAVSLLMQLNLGEHPAGPEPLAVEINMQFNFPHCDEVYWSRGKTQTTLYHQTHYALLQMLRNSQGHSLFIPCRLFLLIKRSICFLTTTREKKKWEIRTGNFLSFCHSTALLENCSSLKTKPLKTYFIMAWRQQTRVSFVKETFCGFYSKNLLQQHYLWIMTFWTQSQIMLPVPWLSPAWHDVPCTHSLTMQKHRVVTKF